MRFKNDEVEGNLEGVIERIREYITLLTEVVQTPNPLT